MKGYTAEEILGRSYDVFFTRDAQAAGTPALLLREAAERGTTVDEGWHVRKDGSRYWGHASVTALRAGDGALVGYATVTRDLTERRRRDEEREALAVERATRRVIEDGRREAERRSREERALREVAHTLAAADDFEEALNMIARLALSVSDADGVYLERVDEAWHTVAVVAVAGVGHPASGVRVPYPGSLMQQVVEGGQPEIVDDLSADESRPMALLLRETCGRPCRGVAAPIRSGEAVLGALVLLRRPGRPRFEPEDADRLAILADMGALALRRLRALEDAVRRARSEHALRQATAALASAFTVEEMLPRMAESALEATDADGAVVERLEADSGKLCIAAAAGSLTLPPGGTAEYAGSYAELVATRGEPAIIERLDRAERPVPPQWAETCPECSALVVSLEDVGAVGGALVLLRGPERAGFRRADVDRALVFADLASLAIRKVHLLDESERGRQDLERLTESRAGLMRGFSHDLKNPLGAALGFVQLLADGTIGQPGTEQQRALERVAAAIRTALQLIDDLVELARAESGRLEITLEAVDMRNVAGELVAFYAPAAEEKRLRLATDFPTTLPVARTESKRVRQIVGNLLSNAVKYTPEGGRVEVSIRQRSSRREGEADERGPWLALQVLDTGPGIAPQDQERIFTEFTRLAPAAATGAGLGLSISRRLARLLGGDLTVESEPGRGSNFTLWLPAASPEPDEQGAPTA